MALSVKQRQRVVEIWDEIEDAYDEDISTERLFTMTIDRFERETGLWIDTGDVTDALRKSGTK